MSDTQCNNLLLYTVSRYEPVEGSKEDGEEEKEEVEEQKVEVK